MLQSFTWQQFLVAALVLSFIWYAVVLLVCYKRGRKGFSQEKKQSTPEPLQHYWNSKQEFEELSEEEDDLLGKSKLPEGVSNMGMGSFGFVKSEIGKEEKLGLVPDVIEELRRIFNILAKEDGNKGDFFSLLQLVKVKYSKIGSSPWVMEINQFIQEHAPFHLTNEELENLWD
ncbi:MAG TPA: hypothetical protein VGB63_06095 [Pedobacter sp.]|jgi:hypothetical protein